MRRAPRLQIGLTARVRLATLGVALALGAVFAILLHAVAVSRHHEGAARHSADVLESAAGIEGSVIGLETGLRGYVIVHELRFLQPYEHARHTLPPRLATLERLVSDTPSQDALARNLTRELDSYVRDYAMPLIAAVRAGHPVGVRRLTEGKLRVDRIRATLTRFITAEDRMQASRRAAAASATHRARVFTILGLTLLVIVVVASGLYASRYIAEPLRRLARSARRLAAGQLEERVDPSGAAELSDLGIAFNQMAASLEEHTHELERLSESSAAQFSAIFEQTPIGLTLFDRHLRCVRCNPALAELGGIVAGEQRGRTVPEVFQHFEPDLSGEFARVLETGRPADGLRVVSQGRTCTMGLFPVRRADDDLIGVAAVVVDVTERERRLERERLGAQRTRELERLTSAISEALTSEEIGRAVVAEAVAALGGDGGVVALLDEGRETLARSAAVGWAAAAPRLLHRLPLSESSPLTDAVRTRRVIHVPEPSEQNLRYPGLAAERERYRVAASLALPLLSGPSCLGGLLVTFSEPHAFEQDELEFAEQVAERCAAGIARAKLYEREHETAAALQSSLMPRALPLFEEIVFGARFRPAGTGAVVGGDFYDVVPLGNDRFVAWIGDVQGKGPGAAAMAALARYTLRAETRHETQPGRLLGALNRTVLAASELGERLLTAICLTGEVRGDVLQLELAAAGHPAPLVLRDEDLCTEWRAPGPLIGLEGSEFASKRTRLAPGGLVILYTDGLTDAHAPRRVLSPADLCRAVDEQRGSSVAEVLDTLLARASGGERDQPRDDIALLGLQFAPRTADLSGG